jgi:hypothetical protein
VLMFAVQRRKVGDGLACDLRKMGHVEIAPL